MISAALMTVVIGAVVMALVVDVAAVVGWLQHRWQRRTNVWRKATSRGQTPKRPRSGLRRRSTGAVGTERFDDCSLRPARQRHSRRAVIDGTKKGNSR
jgi:hypothetical protein